MAEYKYRNYDKFFYRMFDFNVKMKRVRKMLVKPTTNSIHCIQIIKIIHYTNIVVLKLFQLIFVAAAPVTLINTFVELITNVTFHPAAACL